MFGRSDRPRRSPCGPRRISRMWRSRVELPREKSRGRLEDLVGPPQLPVLPLELSEALTFVGGQAGTQAAIDLGLLDPRAKRLQRLSRVTWLAQHAQSQRSDAAPKTAPRC